MQLAADSKKSHVFFRAGVVGLIILVLGALVPIYTHDVTTSGAQALWNRDELYIFVSQNKLAWSDDLWSFVTRTAKLSLAVATPPTFKRTDCLAYRITKATMEQHLVKNCSQAGTIAPYKGSLYAFVGGAETGGVSRWTGSEFVRLSASEAAAIEGSFTYREELFAREGWSQVAFLLPVKETADHAVHLGGIPFTLHVTQSPDGTSKIELISGSNPHVGRIIYQFKNKSGFLSVEGYKHLTE